MRLRVAVHADMADLRRGNHVDHRVHHAQTGTQNGHDSQLLARKDAALGRGDGSLNLDLLRREVSRGLIAHQGGNLAHQLAEFLDAGSLVAQNRQLMLNQRVIQYVQ